MNKYFNDFMEKYGIFFVTILTILGLLAGLAFAASEPVTRMTGMKLITNVYQLDDTYIIQWDGTKNWEATKEAYEFVSIGDRCILQWEAPYTFGTRTITSAFCEDTNLLHMEGK